MHCLKIAHTVPKDPDDHEMMCVHDSNFERRQTVFFTAKEIFQILRGAKLVELTAEDIKKYSALNSTPK